LNPSTTYHYRVRSTDASGNAATSADKTFTTQAGVNYVPNSSLEQKDSATGNPVSWNSDRWGTNKATFSYLTTGHTGTRSVKVQMTSYTDGDAKWYCSPQSIPGGQTYRFADFYKSDVTTLVVVLVITNSGTEEYFGLRNAPASTEWREYSDTFVIPDDAASVSMLHVITSIGYLTTDDYSVSPYTPSGFNRALLTLTFDDGWEDNYTTVLPALNTYGFKITQYLCTQYLTDEYSGSELYKILAFAQAGHEIGSHSVTHPFLTQVSSSELSYELSYSKTYLESIFGTGSISSFATPYGDYNDTVISAIKQYYGSHRSVDVGYNYKDNFDIYDIRVQNMTNTTTLAEVQEWIETAKAGNYWLVIVYHRVATDPEQYDTTPANFNAQLALMSSEGITVLPMRDALAEILPQLS
jgi:peptidoglycan/xylan/chitin deacetylase (PgdA/CDA1 family)